MTRNGTHSNLVAWYQAAMRHGDTMIIFGRDDNHRDILLEFEDAEKATALLKALAEMDYKYPMVVKTATVWFYDHRRQLCATVPAAANLGVPDPTKGMTPRVWKYKVMDIDALATWEPVDSEKDERWDFFLCYLPDPTAWVQSTASNGNVFSQLKFSLSTGKCCLQVWHREEKDDIPPLGCPSRLRKGTGVCLTNVALKLMNATTVSINTSAWTVLISLDNRDACFLPSEVLEGKVCEMVPAIAGPGGSVPRGISTTECSVDTLWLSSTENAIDSPFVKSKHSKSPAKKKFVMSESPAPGQGEEHGQMVRATPFTTHTRAKKRMNAEPSQSVLAHLEEKDKKELHDLEQDPFSDLLTPQTLPPALRFEKIPAGKKGSDYMQSRVFVSGRGQGTIIGGGVKRIRIIFDDEASFKNDSLVPAEKVRLVLPPE